jgi:hypothetical protein
VLISRTIFVTGGRAGSGASGSAKAAWTANSATEPAVVLAASGRSVRLCLLGNLLCVTVQYRSYSNKVVQSAEIHEHLSGILGVPVTVRPWAERNRLPIFFKQADEFYVCWRSLAASAWRSWIEGTKRSRRRRFSSTPNTFLPNSPAGSFTSASGSRQLPTSERPTLAFALTSGNNA